MSMTLTQAGRQMVVDPLADGLPEQDWGAILLHHERFYRASEAHQTWATVGKKCVEYFEDKQWAAADLRKLQDEGRPALVINKIKPLINLALGYHINNETDRKAIPSNDGTGTAAIAETISHVLKNDSERNQLQYVDCEVYLDGLISGRGWWDLRQDFTQNLLGSTRMVAVDPFSLYVDPDATAYDPNDPYNGANYLIKSDWISPDETLQWYGQSAAALVRPLAYNGISSSASILPYGISPEISPARTFAMAENWPDNWQTFLEHSSYWVDTYRRTVRRLDIQHWVRAWAWFTVDLETGDQQRLPDNWDQARIQKLAMWAQQNGQPMMIQRRQTRRLRWTHIIGDTMVFDRWAPIDRFSFVPFFPYFRRGVTHGMVNPLIDPQNEINVRRSARINIIGRSSNGGWKIEKGSMTPQERRNLEMNGGKPGLVFEYDRKGGTLDEPKQITPGQAPVPIAQLEHEAEDDIMKIAGVNAAALGQMDQAAISGRAILARQQQTVIGMEGFRSNWHRSVKLSGAAMVDQIQTFYTEPRLIRIRGKNRTNPPEMMINVASAEGVLNDVTVGRYEIDIGETSLLDGFLAGQFNELLSMAQTGMPIPDSAIIDASSVPGKDELAIQVAENRAKQPPQGQPQPGQPPAKPPGAPHQGGAAPAPPPPHQPPPG